ncbi:MAG TPA: 6-phosphogluconolactonase [Intrasporangium sp.]|uniref:6-phosphogluconolactonase n=1 Tax=Intrasporangium sp. TaxID=1925024 RepID=UPI002D784EB2|nr:6-phosphogluconolactonase [Intrasporangium sp.]HET7398456.1 6-phosphogluconolactonase [Intrasporangium sp.]
MPPEPVVVVHPSRQALADASAARLVTAIVDAQAARGAAHVVLTGGSMGSAIVAGIAEVPGRLAIDPTRVHAWWGDERYLPAGDPDRNDVQNDAAGLSAWGLDPAKVHRIAGPDRSQSAEASARAYEQALCEHGPDAFDVVLLGVGPDGHVASLFPHHPAQRTTGADAVAVHDSPKPPPDRVSLTFERLARTAEVWFLVSGADKAEAVAAALSPEADPWDVPASGPRGTVATRWLLDTDAAGRLRPPHAAR